MLAVALHRFRFAILLVTVLVCSTLHSRAQERPGPRALIVIAHPDDETGVAATVYKITHDLKGTVDLALVTNGEGGYKYSTLAEAYYGLELTEETVGRAHLPRIRKRELMNAGAIIGIGNYFFFDQQDNAYTLNVDSVFANVWDTAAIRTRLVGIMARGRYDVVFCLLPVPETHGHHKGATIMALDAVRSLPLSQRPVVLGVGAGMKSDTAPTRFSVLAGHSETAVRPSGPHFQFDRTVKFGFRDALDYRIIVNWEIAEHKSQGTMQTLMNRGEIEQFWWFELNDPARFNGVRQLFEQLAVVRYPRKTY